MTDKFLYVVHGRVEAGGRVADALRARGAAVEFRSPMDGDALPEVPGAYDGVIVGGGPDSVNEAARRPYLAREIAWTRRAVEAGARYLGICLGAQILAAAFGARVGPRPDGRAECGWCPIEPTTAGAELFAGLERVFQFHYEGFELPPGAVPLARSPVFPNQAFQLGRRALGLQFHPDLRPDMIEDWHRRSATGRRPGAQPLSEQLAEAPRWDAPAAAWLDGFLAAWRGT